MPPRSSEGIKSSQFLYEEEPVEVVFQKPLPQLKVCGEDMGAPVEGTELKLPRWAAKALEDEGYIRIKDEEKGRLQPNDIIKLSWKEERGESLSKLPVNFYPRLRELLTQLNENIKKNPTTTALNEQRHVSIKAHDLINCRLQKILRLSFERTPSKSSIEALEPEELALFNAIRFEIEEWRQRILSEGMK
ncbi:MAG: hypothetical protein ACUVQ5_04720 [Candidatus Methanomethylicaceae archaeon]